MTEVAVSTLDRLRAKRIETPSEVSPSPAGADFLQAAIIVVATVLAYIPALQSGFIWDDDRFLTANPLIHAADGIRRFWLTAEAPDYFPLTSTMLWLEWRLWGGGAFGFHLVNVLLHASSALLIWRILIRIGVPGALLAALLFALHPVNVMSVAWITERKNTLAMFFYVTSLFFYLRHDDTKRAGSYWLSLAAFLCALLSKTAVVMLPFVLLLLCWWKRGRVSGRDVALSLPFFVVAAVLSAVTIWFQYEVNIQHEVVRDESFLQRLIGAGYAVWFYAWKAVAPYGLVFVYTRWNLDAANVVSYLPGVASLALLLLFWIKRGTMWGRALFFGWCYFIVTLFPVLGFFDIYFMRYTYVSDHWQYFSIIGLVALFAGMVGVLWANEERRPIALLLGGAALILYTFLTVTQQAGYRDEETLWRTVIRDNPSAAIAHSNLGVILERQGLHEDALQRFDAAIALVPDYREALFNQGNVLSTLGRYPEAIAAYRRSLEIDPSAANVHNNLGNALRLSGNPTDALVSFNEAIRILPGYTDAYNSMGLAHAEMNNEDLALAAYERALESDPNHVGAINNLAMLFAKRGDHAAAVAGFEAALRLSPDDARAHYNLAGALHEAGSPDDALALYLQALEIDQGFKQARLYAIDLAEPKQPGLAMKLIQDGLRLDEEDGILALRFAWILCCHSDESVRNAEGALQITDEIAGASEGTDPLALDALAAALAASSHYDEAVAVSQRAIKIALQMKDESFAEEMAVRLALYKRREPYIRAAE